MKVCIDQNGKILTSGNAVVTELGILLAETLTWDWAKKLGSNHATMTDSVVDVCIDKTNGLIYVGGYAHGFVDFGNGVTVNVPTESSYLLKTDMQGNAISVLGISRVAYNAYISVVEIDSDGDIYVGISRRGNMVINGVSYTGKAVYDFAVAKINAATMTVAWVQTTASSNGAHGIGSLNVAPDKSVYITYVWGGNLTVATGMSFTSSGNMDTGFAKINPNGTWAWAKHIISPASWPNDGPTAATMDSEGNVYITGYYQTSVKFDHVSNTFTLAGTGTSIDAYLAKYNTTTNQWEWAKQMGGPGNEYAARIIDCDSQNNVYITGRYTNTMTIGDTTLTRYGGTSDIFIAKCDKNGNWLWANQAGTVAAGQDEGIAVAIDENDNLFIAGNFFDTATFGTHSITSSGSNDMFIAIVNKETGEWTDVKQFGSTNADNVYTLAAFNKTLLVGGNFAGTLNYGSNTMTALGAGDGFLIKTTY